MKKRVVSFLAAAIITVMAGASAPAVTASVTISDSNVTAFTNKLEKSGTGTISGVSGTEKSIGDYDCYSDYTVSMTTNTGYAYIKDNSIQNISAESFGWAHFKLAVSEAANFVLKLDLQYTNTASSNKTVTVFNMKNYAQIAGTQQNPKDYSADILFNLTGGKAYVFFGGIIKDEAIETEIPDISYLRQLRLANNAGVAHSYKVSGLLLEAFPSGATLDDVLGYLTDSAAPVDYVKGTYFEGINTVSESADITHGSVNIGDGSSVSGNNTDGYLLYDNKNGGFYRYFLFNNKDGSGAGVPQQENDSVIRHSALISPKSGDKTVSVGKYSTKEELVLLYFDENSAEIRDNNGVAVLDNYDSNTFYQIDFFVNSKDYEYSVYLDGKEISGGTLTHTPVGYISYKNGAAQGSMVLKNIFTKVYALGTSMNTVIGDIYGSAYIELRDFTVLEAENGDYEISAAAVFNNVSKSYTNPKIIYALYKNGGLLNIGGADATEELLVTNDEISLGYGEINRKYPYGLIKTNGAAIAGGDVLSVKAWLVAGVNYDTHLIDSNEVSLTVE